MLIALCKFSLSIETLGTAKRFLSRFEERESDRGRSKLPNFESTPSLYIRMPSIVYGIDRAFLMRDEVSGASISISFIEKSDSIIS